MKKPELYIYNNGATARMHNKRIVFKEADGQVFIGFNFADKNADIPACSHSTRRGKVRDTYLKISSEGMEALVMAYHAYKRSQNQNKK